MDQQPGAVERLPVLAHDVPVAAQCMRNNKVQKSDIYHGIKYVDAGVVHIMMQQRSGWSYVRP